MISRSADVSVGSVDMLPTLNNLSLPSEGPAPKRVRLDKYVFGVIPKYESDAVTIDNESNQALPTREQIAETVATKRRLAIFCGSSGVTPHMFESFVDPFAVQQNDGTAIFVLEDGELAGLAMVKLMDFVVEDQRKVLSINKGGGTVAQKRVEYGLHNVREILLVNGDGVDAGAVDVVNKLEEIGASSVQDSTSYVQVACTAGSVEGDGCRKGVMRYMLAALAYWVEQNVVKPKMQCMHDSAKNEHERLRFLQANAANSGVSAAYLQKQIDAANDLVRDLANSDSVPRTLRQLFVLSLYPMNEDARESWEKIGFKDVAVKENTDSIFVRRLFDNPDRPPPRPHPEDFIQKC